MELITDWARLWAQVVTARRDRRGGPDWSAAGDAWAGRASEFNAHVRRRWSEASAIGAALLGHIDATSSVLDVGAGTGRWAIPLARRAARVTALEPSAAMRAGLQQNLVKEGAANVTIVAGRWPDADVAPHDLVLCAHAMYGDPDLVTFVRRLEAVARRRCCLIVRAPSRDSLMAEAAQIAWGHPHFVPDFTIAYNVLLDMGLHPDVTMERGSRWRADQSPSLEAALVDVKERLGLPPGEGRHDQALLDLLQRRLEPAGGQLAWPGVLRSALVQWPVAET
jgi:SAM-dependent methyltransferase